ncbi:MAG: DUF4097 family beta strand repeat-containing protein [Acidimicrobiales bacterium]
MQWTFHTAEHQRAELDLASGVVEVNFAATDEVQVSLEPLGPATERATELINSAKVTCEGGHLIVSVPKRKLRDTPLRLAVLVPPQSRLNCSTASADVQCSGLAGAVRVATASGDVTMDGPCDSADVSTASGDVRLSRVLGEAHAKTASGDFSVDWVGGRASCDTASGDVEIGQGGSDIKVRTASGDVKVGQACEGDVSVNCASGDIVVGVEAGVGAWLDMVTISGDTKCTLPAENSGEGDAVLRIACRTVSGDIRIQPGHGQSEDSRRWA